MDRSAAAKFQIIFSMVIFGTIGVFVRYIPISSAAIAFFRGAIGTLFLVMVMALRKMRPDTAAIKKNLLLLTVSGGAIGFNWMFLFESYRYTSVATGTLCYYMAPVIVIAASPFLFGEKMTLRKVFCVIAALVGMVFVSGVAENGIPAAEELKGIIFGLCAAALYASVMIMNKKMAPIPAYDKTAIQLCAAAAVILPYCLLTESFPTVMPDAVGIVMLIVVGIFHTGFTYYLYFGSMDALPSHTIAILSYIDPVVALILSACLLKEDFGVYDAIGAVLILGAAFVSEMPTRKK